MPYIGKSPVGGGFHKLDALTASSTDTYSLTLGGASYFPETANQLLVSLNGVIQAPQDSFTVSGSNLIFDSALTASDSIDFVVALGDVLGVGSVSDGAITTAKIGNQAVTMDKLATSGTLPALDGSNLTGVGVAGITSSSTSGTALSIDTNNIVTLPNLVAFSAEWRAGSPANGYLQDWTVRSNQGNAFNVTTGRFTPPVNGTYVFHVNILAEDFSGSTTSIDLKKNETDVLFKMRDDTQNTRFQTISGSVIADLTTSDFVSVYKDTATTLSKHSDPFHIFSGHLLG